MVMKKKMLSACSIGMMLFVLTACGTKTQSVEQAKAGEESVTEQTESTVQEFVKKEEADVLGSYEEQYGEVLDKYYAALSEKWDGQKLSSEGLSQLSLYCQEGNALENVGYAFLDVNGDGVCELMIGAIHGDEFVNKMLFELYTLEDGVPVQIFAGQERDRYYIAGLEEGGYLIANEASSSCKQRMVLLCHRRQGTFSCSGNSLRCGSITRSAVVYGIQQGLGYKQRRAGRGTVCRGSYRKL